MIKKLGVVSKDQNEFIQYVIASRKHAREQVGKVRRKSINREQLLANRREYLFGWSEETYLRKVRELHDRKAIERFGLPANMVIEGLRAMPKQTIIEQIKDAHQELGEALENNSRVDISIEKLFHLLKTAQETGLD